MIFTFNRFGRLGNRLFLFSHLIAFSEQFKIPLYNLAFAEYREHFNHFENDKYCTYGLPHGGDFRKVAQARVLGEIGLIPTVKFWDTEDVVFDAEGIEDKRISLLIESPMVVFEGWRLRSHTRLGQIKDTIREVFRPNDVIAGQVSKRIDRMNEIGDIKVGVHVRWGDFRGTENFFALETFLVRMGEIRNILHPRKVAFLICSPEKIESSSLPGDAILFQDSSPICDLYSLASCDYLLGPPSTFSGWASFYGERPIFTMRGSRKIDDLSMSEIWAG
jgi:hypothetical protein